MTAFSWFLICLFRLVGEWIGVLFRTAVVEEVKLLARSIELVRVTVDHVGSSDCRFTDVLVGGVGPKFLGVLQANVVDPERKRNN